MFGFLKHSVLAVVAWNVSSVITVLEMAFFKQHVPKLYHAAMDPAGRFAAWVWEGLQSTWDWLSALGEVDDRVKGLRAGLCLGWHRRNRDTSADGSDRAALSLTCRCSPAGS